MSSDWLPELLLLSDFDGDWSAYVEAIYERYQAQFSAPLAFQGRRVSRKRWPEYDGKCRTFWHIISEGQDEASRTVDPRRCERISWPRALIEASIDQGKVVVWRNQRKTATRWLIALPDHSYLVVLEDRAEFLLLVTAYPVGANRRKQLAREYEAWIAGQKS